MPRIRFISGGPIIFQKYVVSSHSILHATAQLSSIFSDKYLNNGTATDVLLFVKRLKRFGTIRLMVAKVKDQFVGLMESIKAFSLDYRDTKCPTGIPIE